MPKPACCNPLEEGADGAIYIFIYIYTPFLSQVIEGLTLKLKCDSRLLHEMGGEGGCNEANIMVYMGVIEQRANELLAAHLQQVRRNP